MFHKYGELYVMTIYIAKTEALICAFVLAYAKSRFSHDAAHMMNIYFRRVLGATLAGETSRDDCTNTRRR